MSDPRPVTPSRGAVRSRRSERFNAWLTALLLVAVVVEGNRLAAARLHVRKDFSEDQLFAISDATRSILERVEDQLQVKAYFTERIDSGQMALWKARVEAQLDELVGLAGGRIEVDVQDPSVFSSARVEAQSYGVIERPVEIPRGASRSTQDVWLGAVLRYRGRTEVLPWLEPWSLEADFVQAVHRLLADRRPVIAWTGAPFETPEGDAVFGTFDAARAVLATRYEVVELPASDLESGEPVPSGVELLVVVRPERWHPRAAFALDQYLQRGGRALVLVDQVHGSPFGPSAGLVRGTGVRPTGLESILAAWGAPVLARHAWDPLHAGERNRLISVPGADGEKPQGRVLSLLDPACPTLNSAECFDLTFPPVARAPRLELFFAQPVASADAVEGLVRDDFLFTSDKALVTDSLLEASLSRANEVESLTHSLRWATGRFDEGRRLTLGTVLIGRFPSPFVEHGAPRPFDATREERGARVETTDEPVLDRAADARLVLLGDSDWMRDSTRQFGDLLPGLTESNRIFLENLVDWLVQGDELIALRSKTLRDRPIRSLLEEELARAGIRQGEDLGLDEAALQDRRARSDQARTRSEARRWRLMLAPLAVALAFVLGCGALWNVMQRRAA